MNNPASHMKHRASGLKLIFFLAAFLLVQFLYISHAYAVLQFVEAPYDSTGLDGASSVTVSPDGNHMYAAGSVDDAVAVFSRNSSTGEIAFVEVLRDGVEGVDGLDHAISVTVSPDGNHVYAAGAVDDAVAVFSRNSSTGALTFVEMQKDGVSGVDGLAGARSVTVSLDGNHVYAAGAYDDAVAVFKVINASLSADYGANGLYTFDGSSWIKINGGDTTGFTAWGLKLAAGFLSGTWVYDGSVWEMITGQSNDRMIEWGSDLVLDLGAGGLYIYDGSSWNNLSGSDPNIIEVWGSLLAAGFAGTGLYTYDGSSWSRLTGVNPEGLEAWGTDLAVDFGSGLGLWIYNGSSWNRLAGFDPDEVLAWGSRLALDFGTTGLWTYDGSNWSKINGQDCGMMTVWRSDLAIGFAGSGLYTYNGSSWTRINGTVPDVMTSWGNLLSAYFNGTGLYTYDGSSWTRNSGGNVEGMIEVFLP